MRTYTALLLLFVCLAFFDLATSDLALRRKYKRMEREYARDSLRGGAMPEEQWFDQRLDNFNANDDRTWKQRFFMNETFYKPGGPVFVYIGGEGAISASTVTSGSWIEDAKTFGAMLFSVEHRYYGKSHPTEDMSVENLVYLSSEQALEDLAYFIEYQKEDKDLKSNPWVVFGGSYPGCLAAWFRMKYPHLAIGAVASSGPVFAKLDFYEYLEVVNDAFATTGPGCNEGIAQGMAEIEEAMKTEEGVKQLSEKFKLCTPLDVTDKSEVSAFHKMVTENFQGIVQYDRQLIDSVCATMTQEDKSALDRIALVINGEMDSYQEDCIDYSYKSFLKEYTQTSWESSASVGGRQWYYQTCTEFGYYQSTDSDKQPFKNVPVEFLAHMCKDVYGDKFTQEFVEERISKSNKKYGGYTPNVTNTVFPNGSFDPWYRLSVVEDLSETAKAIFIEGTTHCENMHTASPDDPPQLVEARKQITEAIASWIQ